MSDQKNIFDQEAIEKLQKLTDGHIAMFTTHLAPSQINTRPMSTIKTDSNGVLWFLSDRSSHQNEELRKNEIVDLIYSNKDGSYCLINGTCEISRDQSKIDELWSPIAKAWFSEGSTDPRISILRVQPKEAYYWDTKNDKFVSFVKIAISAVTGLKMDDGVEGKLHVN